LFQERAEAVRRDSMEDLPQGDFDNRTFADALLEGDLFELVAQIGGKVDRKFLAFKGAGAFG